ncbi:MAG TPA: dihydropyrimidinase [Clostridia bacterium]|nr:dihydropyrimidinase [Clostridia bacterium]
MANLLVRGGTVVSATGSRLADVLVEGERISRVEPDLPQTLADEVVDATGLLVLPGVVDVHTHTRVATDAEPDRFFQDSVAAAFGGTTTFLAFNNPGTGSSPAAERSLLAGLREWKAATEADSAIDYGVSLVVSGRMDDPVAELPAVVDAGVPTCKAFMIFDFRLGDAAIFEAMRTLGRRGGMLEVHCEDPVLVDAAVRDALQRGTTSARYHAGTRSPDAEAVATHRAMAFARAADAPVYVVHLSSAAALRQAREAKASGVRAFAETCPHYLALDESRYEAEDDLDVACAMITPPLRPLSDQAALWDGLADRSLDLVASDHVPDRRGIEKAEATKGIPFDQISNGSPGIETLLTVVYTRGVATGRITIERIVELLSTTPARLFGFDRKGAVEPGRDADLVLFDPSARRTVRATELHHTSDYTPYEGFEADGVVRSVYVRGRPVIREGTFVGRRGSGRFLERGSAGSWSERTMEGPSTQDVGDL